MGIFYYRFQVYTGAEAVLSVIPAEYVESGHMEQVVVYSTLWLLDKGYTVHM